MKKKIIKKNKNLWGGRFSEKPSELMVKVNASISFDKKLYEKDILASKVHAQMLSNQNIITKHEENKIIKALDEIQKEIKNNKMKFKNEM